MNSLSSYISGRTPGGGSRGGSASQQSQLPHDARNIRGGGSISNGRGGSRGRGTTKLTLCWQGVLVFFPIARWT